MATEYDQQTQAKALALYRSEGLAAAHRETGIPKSTIRGWAKRDGVKSQATQKVSAATRAKRVANASKREQLKELMLDTAREMLNRCYQPHKEFRGQQAREVHYDLPPADSCKNYITAAAVLVDKYRLESGEAAPQPKSEAPPDGSESLKQYKEALRAEAKEVWAEEEPEEAEPCES